VKAIESRRTFRSPVLNNLKILNSLKALRALSPPPPPPSLRDSSINDMMTTNASKRLNLSLTKTQGGIPINLNIVSNVKMIVKKMLK
jgi:hypothetical protein